MGAPVTTGARSAMAASAAAKVEMHLKVPDHKTPVAALIEKPLAPLEVAAKETDKKIPLIKKFELETEPKLKQKAAKQPAEKP